MDSEAAEGSLLGQRVLACTAANGSYVGELVAVVADHEPWRALVRVDGVISCANHYQAGSPVFSGGARVGRLIEVDGASCSLTHAFGASDYAEALVAEAMGFERSHARYMAGNYGQWNDPELTKRFAWHAEAAAAYQLVALVRQELEPLESVLDLPGGREAVRDVMRLMAREGALPGRDRRSGEPDHPWEDIARSVIRSDVASGIETGFRDELVNRSRYSLGLEPVQTLPARLASGPAR